MAALLRVFNIIKVFLLLLFTSVSTFAIQIAPFRADVTPPLGAPLCGRLVKPATGVSEPLLALGVVLISDEEPVVLCAIDFCVIRGADHMHWREVLAKAAGTSAERAALKAPQAMMHISTGEAKKPFPGSQQ